MNLRTNDSIKRIDSMIRERERERNKSGNKKSEMKVLIEI